RPPLMRLHLIAVADARWWLFNSHHHILLDGWSVALLLKEVVTAYDALRRKEHPRMSAARPYRDYITWLHKQDHTAAEQFWRASLAGIQRPTPLPLGGSRDAGGDDHLPYA